MTKIEYDSPMFYAGFPVFIGLTKLSATDEVLATTYSSSYMLGDTLVMGVGADGQTASNLTVGSRLSVNYLGIEDGLLSDIAGLVSRRTKWSALTEKGAILSEFDDVPILENGLMTAIGIVEQIISQDDISHLFVKITDRLVDDHLVNSDGSIDWAKFDSLEYFGARKDRIYRPVSSDTMKKGQYLKESRKK